MTDKNDTDIDMDADIETDFEDGADLDGDDMIDVDDAPAARSALREMWDNNPLLKLGVLALAGAAVVVTFLSVFGGGNAADEGALIVSPDLGTVAATPGAEEVDPEYRRALEERNLQEASRAILDGTSALPVPIGTSSEAGLQVPLSPSQEQTDPLTAWRQEAEARRQAREEAETARVEAPPADPIAAITPAMPEFAPLIQPVRPQPQPQMVQRGNAELAQNLAAQMRVIVAAQAPASSAVSSVTSVPSSYVRMRDAQQNSTSSFAAAPSAVDPMALQGFGSATVPASAGSAAAQEQTILPAGSVVYGQLMNQLNSDMPGPVLVSLASGPFAGGRAIGTIEVREDYMILSFSRVVKDGVTYAVQAVALDETTTLTGQRSSVDRHYFSRVVLPAAAEFLRGYARSASQLATSTTTTDGGGVVQETSTPDTRQELLSGAEEAADVVSEIFREQARRPVTVHLNKGTTMGLLFLETVTTGAAK